MIRVSGHIYRATYLAESKDKTVDSKAVTGVFDVLKHTTECARLWGTDLQITKVVTFAQN